MTQPQIHYVQIVRPPSRNGIAIAGLVLGIVATFVGFLGRFAWPILILGLLPALLAFIFGIIGLVNASHNGGRRRAAAVWALLLGLLGGVVGFWLAGFVGN